MTVSRFEDWGKLLGVGPECFLVFHLQQLFGSAGIVVPNQDIWDIRPLATVRMLDYDPNRLLEPTHLGRKLKEQKKISFQGGLKSQLATILGARE